MMLEQLHSSAQSEETSRLCSVPLPVEYDTKQFDLPVRRFRYEDEFIFRRSSIDPSELCRLVRSESSADFSNGEFSHWKPLLIMISHRIADRSSESGPGRSLG